MKKIDLKTALNKAMKKLESARHELEAQEEAARELEDPRAIEKAFGVLEKSHNQVMKLDKEWHDLKQQYDKQH